MSKTLYTTSVCVTGGRNGFATSEDGLLKLPLEMPSALGGAGQSTNPEQLFAAGYAACFASSLQFVASKRALTLDELTVTATIQLLQSNEGFNLSVDLSARAATPISPKLLDEAHAVCAYSNALRGKSQVNIRQSS